jgi:hypothetical protein
VSAQTELAAEHYQALADLSLLVDRELRDVKRSVSADSARAVASTLKDVVPALSSDYGDMAASLAADYYESAREVAGVSGRFAAKPAATPSLADLESLIDWGSQPLFFDNVDMDGAFTRVGGALQRVVTNVARETVVDNSVRDPKAVGWKRVASGSGCQFCKMLSGKVYKDQRARFAAHDHCSCTASPTWDSGIEVSSLTYVASKRERTAEERAHLRAYLNEHFPRESAAK